MKRHIAYLICLGMAFMSMVHIHADAVRKDLEQMIDEFKEDHMSLKQMREWQKAFEAQKRLLGITSRTQVQALERRELQEVLPKIHDRALGDFRSAINKKRFGSKSSAPAPKQRRVRRIFRSAEETTPQPVAQEKEEIKLPNFALYRNISKQTDKELKKIAENKIRDLELKGKTEENETLRKALKSFIEDLKNKPSKKTLLPKAPKATQEDLPPQISESFAYLYKEEEAMPPTAEAMQQADITSSAPLLMTPMPSINNPLDTAVKDFNDALTAQHPETNLYKILQALIPQLNSIQEALDIDPNLAINAHIKETFIQHLAQLLMVITSKATQVAHATRQELITQGVNPAVVSDALDRIASIIDRFPRLSVIDISVPDFRRQLQEVANDFKKNTQMLEITVPAPAASESALVPSMLPLENL